MTIETMRTSGGATVHVDDKFAARSGSDFERQITEEQRRVAHKILKEYSLEEKSA